jgi:geranylgeranyl diphosphate synthase type II
MHQFEDLSAQFSAYFKADHFPAAPSSLYEPARYLLAIGGKRIRPVLCLMGAELFDEIPADAWLAATAIELFHNFTLIHDDIMDKAPLRRGQETVHQKWGENTAILAGDVMMVKAYEYLNRISLKNMKPITELFNKTATEVCEGQQLDMDFEARPTVSFDEYLKMITLKTSVLLAAALQTGAILSGAGESNQRLLYEFGKNLGLAFQVQDDYLDCFGDPATFGKQVGGDIKANKKTFLLIHTLEVADPLQKKTLEQLLKIDTEDKVTEMLSLYRQCGADAWATELKEQYRIKALDALQKIAVLSKRKMPLEALAGYLIERQS